MIFNIVFKKVLKRLLVFTLLLSGFLFAPLVLAQGFGISELGSGLAGSLGNSDPRVVAGRIINIGLGFLGVIAIAFIIYGGFIWMSSNGNEEKIETAKKILRNSIIGLLIILASWGIATFIITKLSGAVNGNGGSSNCLEGQVINCGCGGYSVCSNNSFGACIGSDCGGGPGPTSCDSSSSPGCQATDQICAPGNYCDDADCSCKPEGNLGDPCNSDPNGGTCVPDSGRCSEYLSCDPQSCTCEGPPVITGISPAGGFCSEDVNKACAQDSDCTGTCDLTTPNGSANNFITISGKNFGEYSSTSSQVIFAASSTPVVGKNPADINPTCVNSWRDDQIVVAVPSGSTSGNIKVVNKDGLSDTTNNSYGPEIADFRENSISRPGLCYLSPNRGLLSANVSYQGINLQDGQAFFGNYKNNVAALDSQFNNSSGLNGTSTIPNIKAGHSSSFVQKNINGYLEKSNYLDFIKDNEPESGPYISSFSPTSGNTGQYVTIRGHGFGGTRGSSHVYFGDVEANYDFPDACLNSVWKNDRIIVKVPAGLSNGDKLIKIEIATSTIDTQNLDPAVFQFDDSLNLKPSLCKIEPERGMASTPVTLWGEYFGPLHSESLIKFNYDKSATGTIEQDNRSDMVVTSVPVGAITGPVYVVNNSVWGNELNFSIGECQVDADCGAQICCPRGSYKAGRCVNTSADCSIDIPNSVFVWGFNTGFGTSTASSTCTGPDCPPPPGGPDCSGISDISECAEISGCCFDAKIETPDKCRAGTIIPNSGVNPGYCAYYECTTPPNTGNPTECASSTPVKLGSYDSVNSCVSHCVESPPPPTETCGCVSDTDCSDSAILGCGLNTCCQARPEIASTSPAHLDDNVCRNGAIQINFNSLMDSNTFNNNVLLLEERDYGDGVCPPGTSFVAKAKSLQLALSNNHKISLKKLKDEVYYWEHNIWKTIFGSVSAGPPDTSNKLYCSIPGIASSQNNGKNTSLVFTPQKILDPASNYYFIIKGDADLNSNAGVLSNNEIGFNGKGYANDASLSSYTPGEDIYFNGRSYKNSQIIKFTTLSDQGPSAGLCLIDHIKIFPSSYLFKTADNSLDENDINVDDKTFDTVSDHDKVFSAQAYSADNQLLHPTTAYAWDWDFSVNNSSVATIIPVSLLANNKSFVKAVDGVSDDETKLVATINMSRFNGAGSCTTNCNAYFGGDGFSQSSNLYVFLCNNPWPPVDASGAWQPWVDNCQGASGGSCSDYNYKFYYCRDAGSTDTTDDLPAIINKAVIRGTSNNLVCSSDQSACATAGSNCGLDQNGDGVGDGICIQNVLKESYFFREGLPSAGTVLDAVDQETSGEVKVTWTSNIDNTNSYKVYYWPSGTGPMFSREFQANDVCSTSGSVYNCEADISGLVNNVLYVFEVSAISTNRTETPLSSNKTATPTDKTAPSVPNNFKLSLVNSQLKFSWLANNDDTSIYRLYHGVNSGQYGESFDSAPSSTSLVFPLNKFPLGDNYFSLTALDNYQNESAKSTEISFNNSYPDSIVIGNHTYYPLTNDNWWYKSLNISETPVNRDCLVKFNTDSDDKPICNSFPVNSSSTAWFMGTVQDINTPYCSTSQCDYRVNPNKCRWSSGSWSRQCYIHD